MPDTLHGVPNKIYLSAHFGWAIGSGWEAETAQVGVRMAVCPTISAPLMGELFTLPEATQVTGVSVSGSDATWTWAQTWEAVWGTPGVDAITVNLATQKDMANDVVAWWNAIKANHGVSIRLQSVKLAPVQSQGEYSYGATEFRLKAPIGGGSATQQPPELSVAVSIMADVIGRRGRGRMFLPGLGTPYINMFGKVASGPTATVNLATKLLIDNLQQLPGGPTPQIPVVTVCSNNTPTGYRPTVVRVGDHLDVQRRRQHQMEEVYTVLSL